MVFNVDVDNTINNFIHQFIFFYNNISGKDIKYEKMTDYDLTSLGIDRYTLETLFFKNNRFYETLVPEVGSVSTVKGLVQKGHTVKFVTSIDYDVVQSRIDFIAKYFPNVDVNRSLIVTNDKNKIFADFVIDDLPLNVKGNVNDNCKYILIKRPWNEKEYDEIYSIPMHEINCYCCENWLDIYDILTSFNII